MFNKTTTINFDFIKIKIRILYEKFLVFISTGKTDYEIAPLRENIDSNKNFDQDLDDEIEFYPQKLATKF